jgi:hypothetical protein
VAVAAVVSGLAGASAAGSSSSDVGPWEVQARKAARKRVVMGIAY